MQKLFALIVLGLSTSLSAVAESQSPLATYILQASSNLECAKLDIQIVSSATNASYNLSYDEGPFSAVDLIEGEYHFGEIACHKKAGEVIALATLGEDTAPISLKAGQAYFGGKLLIELVDHSISKSPELIANRIRRNGRYRDSDRECCDPGVSISGKRSFRKTVNFYSPPLERDALDEVRGAFGASEEQLIYLPLTEKEL